MDNYIKNVLPHENWAVTTKRQHSPYKYRPTAYRAKSQLVLMEDTSQLLGAVGVTRVQCIVGALFYYV